MIWAMRKGAAQPPLNYWLPRGDREVDRLNVQYWALNMQMGNRGYIAPIGTPSTILDVGSGTGQWCGDMAEAFPGARVIGIDVEPPREASDKYTFIKHDVRDRLPFEDGMFDYVHQRLLVAAIQLEQWPSEVGELARVTKPGGYVELLETWPRPSHDGPATHEMWALIRKLEKRMGHDLGGAVFEQLPSWLAAAGLEQVAEQVFAAPIGSWGGRIGEMLWRDIEDVYIQLAPVFSKKFLIPPGAEGQAYLHEKLGLMLQEYEETHGTFTFKCAWGRKPG
jgi:SAM-dependent methyltransferase